MTKIIKQTARDLQEKFQNLSYTDVVGGGNIYDYDGEYVYVSSWDSDTDVSIHSRYKYSLDGLDPVIDGDSGERVSKETVYTPSDGKATAVLAKMHDLLNKCFGETDNTENIIKQFDNEFKTVIEPLYMAYGEVDGHGDGYKNEEAVYDLVKSLMEGKDAGTLQTSLFHKHKTKVFSVKRAWVNEKECMMGETLVKALQPLVEIEFHSEKAFEMRMSGDLQGLSIGATGSTELVKDYSSSFEKLCGSTKGVATRLIKNFKFLHKGAHLAYTDRSVGGAASLMNDFILVKEKGLGMDKLSESQAKLVEDLEEEFVPLEKKLKSDSTDKEETPSTPNTGEVYSGVDNENLNKGNDKDMSQELLQDKIEQLEKQLQASKLEKTLSKYNLDSEVSENLSDAMAYASEEHSVAIVKALDSIQDKLKASLVEAETALEKAKGDLEDAGKEIPEESELNKELEKELGNSSEDKSSDDSKLTLAQRQSKRNTSK